MFGQFNFRTVFCPDRLIPCAMDRKSNIKQLNSNLSPTETRASLRASLTENEIEVYAESVRAPANMVGPIRSQLQEQK